MVHSHSVSVDLHVHSILSYDGGISQRGLEKILTTKLDVVAITDHNSIEFAVFMKKKLGEKIIVGEEIASRDGEVIGLFLKTAIEPGLSLAQTAQKIHNQGGMVYIPHPFEKQRSSVSWDTIQQHTEDIDVLETFNARSFGRKKTPVLQEQINKLPVSFASSSDAHCALGIGTAYTILADPPTQNTLVSLLKKGDMVTSYAPIFSYLCPFVNKLRYMFYNK